MWLVLIKNGVRNTFFSPFISLSHFVFSPPTLLTPLTLLTLSHSSHLSLFSLSHTLIFFTFFFYFSLFLTHFFLPSNTENCYTLPYNTKNACIQKTPFMLEIRDLKKVKKFGKIRKSTFNTHPHTILTKYQFSQSLQNAFKLNRSPKTCFFIILNAFYNTLPHLLT